MVVAATGILQAAMMQPCVIPAAPCRTCLIAGAGAGSLILGKEAEREGNRQDGWQFTFALAEAAIGPVRVGSLDAYDCKLPFAASFAITDVRLVVPVMCSVPGTPK